MDQTDIEDVFAPVGAVRCKRMFGGHGIYIDGQMFALEADGEIFLKADAVTRLQFEQAGSQPFMYAKNGKPYAMSYWRLPEAALDDPDILAHWTRLALEAARRSSISREKSRLKRPGPRAAPAGPR